MRSTSFVAVALFGGAIIVCVAAGACGSNSNSTNPGGGSSSGSGGSGGSSGSGSGSSGGGSGGFGSSSGGSGSSSGGQNEGDGGIPCPAGLQCNVVCGDGGTTSISGTVYDPAGKDPIYNVAVYVPAVPLVALPKGVPTGADSCNCGALFQSGALTNTSTAVDGTFTLTNVPVGSNVPLVIQIGKWRRQFPINVAACTNNQQPASTLWLPSSVPVGDTNTNIPDIAVSTGTADTLECLMHRIGLPTTEYVAGNATGGHIHVFAGGKTDLFDNDAPESPGFPSAPVSSTSLWGNVNQMMPYDIVLLSCEGGETAGAQPAVLEQYLNAGGRAFASHFHYAWLSGPIANKLTNSYSANPDWSNLASWQVDPQGETDGQMGGIIDQTLNGSGKPFSKGVYLDQWLSIVKAIPTAGVAAGELSIYQPRYNATVSAANTPSQPWITADTASGFGGSTMYFSFDTPVDAGIDDAGEPQYCGRAVFSDLHVSGATIDTAGTAIPQNCLSVDLSPQEKALEFMLFDLSSCVLPDTVSVPPPDAGLPPPPR